MTSAENLAREKLLVDLAQGRITRRQFMSRMLVASLGLAGVSAALAGCGTQTASTPAAPAATPGAAGTSAPAAATRQLTPTFYQWIVDLHPHIPEINKEFPNLNFQIAPVEGFGIERFVAEAKNQESTWDVYVGMTPFVEMTALIEAGVIEPWDPYIPQEVLDDLIPAIREECTVDGKLYSWPFLLDIVGTAWHSGLAEQAGITNNPPGTWDDYLANARQIVDSGVAPYGCTFDSHGWRSLVPFTHSLSTDVYTDEGLFDFTSEPAIEALKLMKEMMALSHPNILEEGATDGGVNGTPDEVAWAAQRVGYYTKYYNAPLRFAANWQDPSLLTLGALPKFADGEGATVFWTTGCCLFKYGQNKEMVPEYIRKLTYDETLWQNSIVGTPTAHPGQLPPYKSLYAKWDSEKPDWMPEFVGLIRNQLEVARAIPNHAFGLTQFQIGKQYWERYLKGEESDPLVALQAAKDAVAAEMKKVG